MGANSLVSRLATAAALLLCVAAIFGARLHTFDEPLERDLTTYAAIGHEMLHGRPLYSDLWDHKPPAIHITYAAAEICAGYGPHAIFLLGVTSALLTLAALSWAGWLVSCSLAGAAWAGIFWTLCSSSLVLGSNQPNTESFVNVVVAWSVALTLWSMRHPRAIGPWIGIGLLMAWGSLYKQPVGGLLLPLAALHIAWAGQARFVALRNAATALGIVVAAWGATFAWFAWVGHFNDFWDAVFVFNRWYAQQPDISTLTLSAPARGISLLTGLPLRMIVLQGAAYSHLGNIIPWVITPAMLAMGTGLIRGPRDRWAVVAAGYFGALGIAAVAGFWFPHYVQLVIPPAALAAGAGVASWSSGGWRWPVRAASLAAGLACVAGLTWVQAPHFRASAREWSRLKYGEVFITTHEFGQRLDRMLAPGETFFMLGSSTGLYFESRRSPPAGVFYDYPTLMGPLVNRCNDRVVRDLERTRPEATVIVSIDFTARTPPTSPILQWLRRNYVPLPVQTPSPSIMVLGLRGGRLQREMESARAKP